MTREGAWLRAALDARRSGLAGGFAPVGEPRAPTALRVRMVGRRGSLIQLLSQILLMLDGASEEMDARLSDPRGSQPRLKCATRARSPSSTLQGA